MSKLNLRPRYPRPGFATLPVARRRAGGGLGAAGPEGRGRECWAADEGEADPSEGGATGGCNASCDRELRQRQMV